MLNLPARRIAALAALGCGLGALTSAAPAPASPATHSHRAQYYLALGDSVAVWNGPRSYPYLLLAHYRRRLPGLKVDDIAVSGATTTTMLNGGQYAAALSFLRTHKGHVALITIDIGGNDIIPCALSIDSARPDSPCAVAARATIKRNLTRMLRGLRAAAPRVPVVGMSYYDPLLGEWLAGGTLRELALTTVSSLVALNRELTTLYGGPRKTADVQGIFRSTDLTTMVASPWGTVPIAVKRACSWLDITCHAGAPEDLGDDPNDAGAVVIATAFERTLDRVFHRRPGR
jgi:lysophospholipase L1-like esterase